MKRFYRIVTVDQIDQGFAVRLDNRMIKTAAGGPQIVPNLALAKALAAEWEAQGEALNRTLFRFRDLADYALDIVRAERVTAVSKLLAFAETDTLCYRADPDEALYRRQQDVWEPLLTCFEAREGVGLERVSGIMHRSQPVKTLEKLRARLNALDDFILAGLHTASSLAASLSIGLSALEKEANADSLWAAANLEELWQAELWGQDGEAEARLAQRRAEFGNAVEFMRLAAN